MEINKVLMKRIFQTTKMGMLIKSWFEYLNLRINGFNYETGKSTREFYYPQPRFHVKIIFIRICLRLYHSFTEIL